MEPSGIDIDDVIDNGRCVYSLCWDTGGPFGGTGSERVYFFGGAYYVLLDDGDELKRPSSLREAIAETEQLYKVGSATTEIESAELSVDEILSMLEPFDGLDDAELVIKINGNATMIKST
jgi:hypothetical protein